MTKRTASHPNVNLLLMGVESLTKKQEEAARQNDKAERLALMRQRQAQLQHDIDSMQLSGPSVLTEKQRAAVREEARGRVKGALANSRLSAGRSSITNI